MSRRRNNVYFKLWGNKRRFKRNKYNKGKRFYAGFALLFFFGWNSFCRAAVDSEKETRLFGTKRLHTVGKESLLDGERAPGRRKTRSVQLTTPCGRTAAPREATLYRLVLQIRSGIACQSAQGTSSLRHNSLPPKLHLMLTHLLFRKNYSIPLTPLVSFGVVTTKITHLREQLSKRFLITHVM